MSGTTAQIREFILANFLFGDADQMPEDDASLVDAGVVDSTGILELIEYLESNFGITISDAETVPENLDTIASMTAFVDLKTSAA